MHYLEIKLDCIGSLFAAFAGYSSSDLHHFSRSISWSRQMQCVCVFLLSFLFICIHPFCFFFFFFTFFSTCFAHRIAPLVININIDIGDKRIVFPSNFHLPFSRRNSKQPTRWLIPPISLLSSACSGDGII